MSVWSLLRASPKQGIMSWLRTLMPTRSKVSSGMNCLSTSAGNLNQLFDDMRPNVTGAARHQEGLHSRRLGEFANMFNRIRSRILSLE
jgi:hypothetical protein